MNITVIESEDQTLLVGFMHAMLFTTDANVEDGPGFLIITSDHDCDNVTYTLTREGLEFKHTGVEI